MKTKQKKVNRSAAMKAAWKKRKHRERIASIRAKRKPFKFIDAPPVEQMKYAPPPPVKNVGHAKWQQSRISDLTKQLERAQADLRHSRTAYANLEDSVREPRNAIRRGIATHMLNGLLASVPVADRTMDDPNEWARRAYVLADALLAVEHEQNR